MIDASLVRHLSPGIVILRTRCGQQMWTLGKARKAAICVICEQGITAGDSIFRPLTHVENRYWRIHRHCIGTVAQEV